MPEFTPISLLTLFLITNTNAHTSDDCIKYEIDPSSFTYPTLPDDISNRDYFPDPATYTISSTKLKICNKNGDTYTKVKFIGTGFALKAPTTVWYEYSDTSDLIFEYTYPFGPLASVKAAFTNGRDISNEPNIVPILNNNGDFKFEIILDYNLLLPDQIPLLNRLETITQSAYCDIDLDNAETLCQNPMRSSDVYTFVGMEYLRAFDTNGQQIVDTNGNAQVIRSPSAAGTLVMVTHIDLLTHGMDDGTLTSGSNCNETDRWDCDDIYMLVVIPLPDFDEVINGGMNEYNVQSDEDMHYAMSDGMDEKDGELKTNVISDVMIELSVMNVVFICIGVFVCMFGVFVCGYCIRDKGMCQRKVKKNGVHFKINKEDEEINMNVDE